MTGWTALDMHAVDSSHLTKVGHCGGALWIEFKDGTVCRYPGGGYFHNAIRKANLPHERMPKP